MQNASDSIAIFLVVTTLIILVLTAFIVITVYLYRKGQLAHLRQVEFLRSEYDKNVLKTQVEIQEMTFQNISREIHDNINLSLTLAKLHLNTLKLDEREGAEDLINSSITLISTAIRDLTDLSRSMNSDVISEQGLLSALEAEIQKLSRLDFLSVEFEVSGSPIFMDVQKEVVIFRIIQESFNNILKHAKARTVRLRMFYDTDSLTINISDDGVGFAGESRPGKRKVGNGLGLRNMQKRTELLNGTFQINSVPGGGTSIEILIPS